MGVNVTGQRHPTLTPTLSLEGRGNPIPPPSPLPARERETDPHPNPLPRREREPHPSPQPSPCEGEGVLLLRSPAGEGDEGGYSAAAVYSSTTTCVSSGSADLVIEKLAWGATGASPICLKNLSSPSSLACSIGVW